MEQKADIGVYGLAVMGGNLARNFAGRGFVTAVGNRTPERVDAFLDEHGAGLPLIGCRDAAQFAAALKRPRKLFLMVKAGEAVDECLREFLPFLEAGDIVLDGGNSFYRDTARREAELEARGIFYLGVGVSGGEEGALHGPSFMPGGTRGGWPSVEPMLKAAAARAEDGAPCCEWIGPGGAGHFVKMVHNGIEYADMALLSEAYGYLRDRLGRTQAEIAGVFEAWRRGPLNGYLVDITARILRERDEVSGGLLIDRILDTPGQKGTGRWTAAEALEAGVPAPSLAAAVFQRNLDAQFELRREGQLRLPVPAAPPSAGEGMGRDLEPALHAAKIVCYAQGFELLRRVGEESGWGLEPGRIALLWRGGCIIRARFLDDIAEAYRRDPGLASLLFDPAFREVFAAGGDAWRRIVADGALSGSAMSVMSSALAWYDGRRRGRSPANLIQAQRDFFGGHTFERTDRPRGEFFHHLWNP